MFWIIFFVSFCLCLSFENLKEIFFLISIIEVERKSIKFWNFDDFFCITIGCKSILGISPWFSPKCNKSSKVCFVSSLIVLKYIELIWFSLFMESFDTKLSEEFLISFAMTLSIEKRISVSFFSIKILSSLELSPKLIYNPLSVITKPFRKIGPV